MNFQSSFCLLGTPVFKNSYIDVQVQKSDIKNVNLSPTQKLYLKPEKFSDIVVDVNKDFNHLKGENLSYVNNKLRHAKYGFYTPPSINYDVIVYGIHGGAEWPGATLYRDKNSTNLIIPSNNDPWILRINYQEKVYTNIVKFLTNSPVRSLYLKVKSLKQYFTNLITPTPKNNETAEGFLNLKQPASDEQMYSNSVNTSFRNRTDVNKFFATKLLKNKIADKIYKFIPGSSNNVIYKQKCSSCHGVARQGRYQTESTGDNFYPSLVGITRTDKWSAADTFQKVLKIHKEHKIDLDLST